MNSFTLITSFVFSIASLNDSSTSLTITCSPKAEIKCFILPLTITLKGYLFVNLIVSPILYLQRPAEVEIIIT